MEAAPAAVLLQSGATTLAGRIAAWGRRPPGVIVAVADCPDSLQTVGDHLRHAVDLERPVSMDNVVEAMEARFGTFNALWVPLESEALWVTNLLCHSQ